MAYFCYNVKMFYKESYYMDISVIVVNYNQSDLLKGILLSLSHQKTTATFEIIISDDGSNIENIKKTFKIIKDFSHLKIKYVFQQDLGYRIAQARNNAIRIAVGKIIITLDGDIIPKQNFLESHLKLHQKRKNILAYADRSFKDINELDEQLNNLSQILAPSTNYNNTVLEKKEKELKQKSHKPWQRVFGFNMSFPNKPEYLFNENFKGWGLEDIEFAYRLNTLYGCKIMHSSAKMIHINKTSKNPLNPYLTKDKKQLKKFFQNVLYFIEEHGKNLEIIKLLYVPNVKTKEKKDAAEESINFYQNYLKDIPNNQLYTEALHCLKQLINAL